MYFINHRLQNAGYDIDAYEDKVIQQLFENVGPLTTSLPGKVIADLGN